MGGSSKKQTVGYRYFLGMHMVLCHGPIDRLTRIRVDEKNAWQGGSAGGTIAVNAPDLFGGESREGGVSGVVDIEMGYPLQGQNPYLASKLGAFVPNFRGVVGIVLRHCYLGVNPYLKKWAFEARRIRVRKKGELQWYVEKAEIPNNESSIIDVPEVLYVDFGATGWKYKVEEIGAGPAEYAQENFDDSSWQVGQAPFGDRPHPSWDFNPTPNTIIPVNKEVWMRRVVYSPGYDGDIVIKVFADNFPSLWWNGEPISIGSTVIEGGFVSATIPVSKIKSTGNVVAYRVQDIPNYLVTNSIQADLKIYVGAYTSVAQVDMNPAHIIRECLTDPDWGMGYQDSDIDDASFTSAANALHAEGMGISLLWDRQTAIEEFIKEIVKHIDAVLYVDRQSGKFTLKLIRNDFDENDLLVLNPSNIDKISDFTRPAFGELTNSITVNYWDCLTGTDASLTVQDIALSQMQGVTINTTVQYPGFTKKTLASRVAQRDLKTLSTPLISCTIYANRDAASLNIGDCFKLTWPDYELDEVVMRVTGIAYGDGRSNRVRINCSQDVFALPATSFIPAIPPVWEDPNSDATAAQYRIVTEAPYFELVQRLGQANADQQISTNNDIAYLIASAGSPSGAINGRLAIDNGAGYENNDYPMDFCPVAVTSSAIGFVDTVIPLSSFVGSGGVVVGTHAQIGDELVKVISIAPDLSSVTVGRAVLDTLPAKHAAGSAILFWDAFGDSDNVEYVAGESLGVKILPTTGRGTLALADAPEDNITFIGRAFKPYPPGNFKINSLYYPETIAGDAGIVLSWAHRDRLQQTGGDLVVFTDGNIGPESGVTYTLAIYSETEIKLREVTGLTTTTYAYPTTEEVADLGGVPTDPTYDNTVLLLAMEGTNESTVILDTSKTPKTVTVNGNAKLSTAVKKNGVSSCVFDGAGDYLQMTHADFAFGNGNFTLEAYVYFNDVNSGGFGSLALSTDTGVQGVSFWLTGSGAFRVRIGQSVVGAFDDILGVGTLATGRWYHIAVTREGIGTNQVKLWLDGSLNAQGTSARNINGTAFTIGRVYPSENGNYLNGYVDSFRAKKGVAVYTAPFTPPGPEIESPLSGSVRLNGKLRITVEAVRSAIASYQRYDYTVERTGYGFNYGKRYGS